MVRLDGRNNRIVILVADTIQIEIYPNAKVTVQ
ncbi:DUF6888 family protein [Tolypothrix bouteillei]